MASSSNTLENSIIYNGKVYTLEEFKYKCNLSFEETNYQDNVYDFPLCGELMIHYSDDCCSNINVKINIEFIETNHKCNHSPQNITFLNKSFCEECFKHSMRFVVDCEIEEEKYILDWGCLQIDVSTCEQLIFTDFTFEFLK